MADMDDDDGADRLSNRIISISKSARNNEIVDGMTRWEWEVAQKSGNGSNLSTESIAATSGKCETCETVAILGNGLCVK